MTTIAGERRIVTVLFADVVGSTTISERLGPERFALLMDEVMRIMGAEVERFEGTVVQFVGDELYAVFGAPRSHEDDSERAVRAGMAIQRALGRYAQEVLEAYGVELAVRIAINTGPVVIRPESDDPYNAMGDTVNVASRIQKLVAGGEIVIGRETKAQVDSCFELEKMGSHELRGVTAPVETFRVLGPLEDVPEQPLGLLVGRDFELTVLERAFDGLAEGRGTIVSIVGEPGIGKSRLLAEATGKYRDRIRFIEGRALSYASNLPYWPIRELLREWLGVGSSAPEARARLELKAALSQLFGEEADAVYPFIGGLLGLALEPEAVERIRELSRESVQRETYELVRDLVVRIARESSMCLVLEDLQWADESTLELLEKLLSVTEQSAVGLVFLYRSERELASWRLGERARQRHPHRYREIELEPLPDDASRALAASVAGAELPEPVAQLLAVRSGGNPFFLEEALHDLVERGSLTRENGRLVLAVGEDELAVPTLLQGALQARLDRLDPQTRETLNLAAVIGRTFAMPLLERILSNEHVVSALAALQRLDLVVEQIRRPVPQFRFRHGLVQEVAYASLVDSKRRKLHLKVGEALEALYPDGPEEVYGVLARHFTEADAPEKAADYLLLAGDAARALYADQQAIAHYSRAREFLARLGDDRRARDTLFKIALARHLAFDFAGAEEAYDEAFCCRVDEPPPPERTERIETVIDERPEDFVPGDLYSTQSLQLAAHLFRGLLAVDGGLTVVPDMADNFRVSSDGTSYLFRLREGARWSDGEPLTADDFVFAWQRLREEERTTAFLLGDICNAEALDDRTLEVQVCDPRSYLPYLLASWAFPWPRHKVEELGDDWRRPDHLVSNGPFVLSELDDEHALLTANPYWNGAHGNVREILVQFRGSDTEVVEGWLAGSYDVAGVHDERALAAPNTLHDPVSLLTTNFLGFRTDRPPLSNVLVRRAFAHALDRSRLGPSFGSITRLVTRGGALPPAMPGHSPKAGIEYDPGQARRLLEEAGFPDGRGLPELELAVPAWLERPETITDQWAELGIRVRVRRVSKHLCQADLGTSADLYVTGWTADFPDPEGFFLGLFSHGRWPIVYRDDELLELLTRARAAKEQGERMRLYHEIDHTWVRDQAAIVPLTYSRMLLLRRPWIEGVVLNPLGRTCLEQVVVKRSSPTPA
jgi:ABC-type transport system substrate-binding protein/class 3 adenylate cyclase